MRRYVEQMSVASHQRILDERLRKLGRAGGSRVPDDVLFPPHCDPTHEMSDTGIFRAVDALNSGRDERARRERPK
jgi:hypothetical protein